MTNEQKLKKYMTAIKRRLNLPGQVRDRVMADLAASIQARREAGQTDEEIYADLGTPAQVAAEWNEQLKDYAYTKSKWRWAALAGAVIGGLMLAFQGVTGLLVHLLNLSMGERNSVGIIGGADGPTAIFVTSSWTPTDLLPWALLLVMGIVAFWKLGHLKKE